MANVDDGSGADVFPDDEGAAGEPLDADVVGGLEVEGCAQGRGEAEEALSVRVADGSDIEVSVGYAKRAGHGGRVGWAGHARQGVGAGFVTGY